MIALWLISQRYRGRGNRVDNTKDLHRFVFYGEWLENIKGLPVEEQMKIVYDMVQYGTGNEPQFQDDPMVMMGLNFVKGAIEKSKQDYINKVNNGNNYGRKRVVNDNEIYNLAKNGMSSAQISEELGISKSSVDHSVGWKRRKEKDAEFVF